MLLWMIHTGRIYYCAKYKSGDRFFDLWKCILMPSEKPINHVTQLQNNEGGKFDCKTFCEEKHDWIFLAKLQSKHFCFLWKRETCFEKRFCLIVTKTHFFNWTNSLFYMLKDLLIQFITKILRNFSLPPTPNHPHWTVLGPFVYE